MRKIIAFIPAAMLIAALAVPASACTPRLQVPKVPQLSGIRFEIRLPVSFPEGCFQNFGGN